MVGPFSNPEIVGVIFGKSTLCAKMRNRPSHTFIYKVSGESVYCLREKDIHLTAGGVLFIPEGESYSFEKVSEGESLYCLVNFRADFSEPPAPEFFARVPGESVHAVMRQMERHWRHADETAEGYEILALFYHMLALLTPGHAAEYRTARQKELIDPAASYMEEHVFDPDMRIAELAKMCGVSETTFRKSFEARFGLSPRKYIIRRRLLRAKVILESGEYDNISEVAQSVGYEDPHYFSKHFRAFFGVAPSEV